MAKSTVAAIKRHRTKKLAKLLTRAYYLHKKKRDEEMYTLICDEFVELGGVYIKFLQGVLLRSKIMKKWHSPNKLKIFENLESEPVDIAVVLRRELGEEKLRRIALVQPQPFAAGSFGQVYYAQLDNGKHVIIKLLRPMIRELLRYDLKLLGGFYKNFFVKLSKNMDIKLDTAVKEFSDATLRETDYIGEANFAHELFERYKNHPSLVIPETYLELCSENIIVQDYIGGISGAQLVKLASQGVDIDEYISEQTGSNFETQLEVFSEETMMSIFQYDKIPGDPHPGNIKFLADNKVGMIDFGVTASTPKDKSPFFGILEGYYHVTKGAHSAVAFFENGLRFFVGDLYRSLRRIAKFINDKQKNESKDYVEEVTKIAEKAYVEAMGTDTIDSITQNDQNVMTAVNKIINKGNRFGLVMKLESTEVLRTLQTLTSLLASLGKYELVMERVLGRVIERLRLEYPEVIKQVDEQVSLSEAIEVVVNWLERVADRDPELFRELSRKIMTNPSSLVESNGE